MGPEHERAGGPLNMEIVREMNRELRGFLEHSLASETFWDTWSAPAYPGAQPRCWEINDCRSEACPSFGAVDPRCWLTSGTLCGGEVQGDFARKYQSCFNCAVLGRLESDALRALYENINILIHHLKERDARLVSNAITDQLTGVYNRLYFNEYMGKRLAQANRYAEDLALIMIDLDGFKLLNDTHGHLAGDAVLVETADLLRRVVRDADLIFRYGGDEFLLVLSRVTCAKAKLVKGRIQQAVAAWNSQQERYGAFKLSLSIGCSAWSRGDDLAARIGEADAQMYHEKHLKKRARLAAAP